MSLTYGRYLKVPELLALQECRSQPAHHDETLFIVIHQVYELWFKQVLHEVDHAACWRSAAASWPKARARGAAGGRDPAPASCTARSGS